MSNGKKEIQNMLKAEIILLAGRLLKEADSKDFVELTKQFKKLYNKIAAWEYLNEESGMVSQEVTEQIFGGQTADRKTEQPGKKETPSIPKENINKQPEQEATPKEPTAGARQEKAEKIKNPISKHEDLYKQSAQAYFREKTVPGAREAEKKPKEKLSVNIPELRLGIADKVALVNNLFDKNTDVFESFVNEINQTLRYDAALEIVARYRDQMDWTGKDEYEFRLLQLIQAKFA